MKTIGLYGGTFNPVHLGHTIIAGYIAEVTEIDEVWFVLSPLNPMKSDNDLTDKENHRLHMLQLAINQYNTDKIKLCDIELSLPRPSYSINTLTKLKELYPEFNFRWIIGSDNWQIFKSWKDADKILKDFGLIIYPRAGYDIIESLPDTVLLIQAPIIEISSSIIREGIKNNKNMDYFLSENVNKYISLHHLYH